MGAVNTWIYNFYFSVRYFFTIDHTFSHSNSSKLFDKFSDIKQYILDANHINYKGNISIPWLLGLTCTDNVQWLRGFISTTNPNLFTESHEFFKANQKRIEILNLGTRTAHRINKELQKNNSNSMNIIIRQKNNSGSWNEITTYR